MTIEVSQAGLAFTGEEIRTGKQAVAVGGEVDADNLGALVGDDIQEARILVGEAVVVLAPDNSRQEDVKRGDLDAPLDLEALFNPFAMLQKGQQDSIR